MNYLCLVYRETMGVGDQQQGQGDAIAGEVHAYSEELRHSGRHIISASLQPVRPTTVRVRAGSLSIDDGRLIGANERPDGLYLISARDLNDAIIVAARMPQARLGCVEIWPLTEGDLDDRPA